MSAQSPKRSARPKKKAKRPPAAQICHGGIERWLADAFTLMASASLRLSGDFSNLLPVISRTCAHAAIVIVAVAVIGLGSIDWPAQAANGHGSEFGPGAGGDGELDADELALAISNGASVDAQGRGGAGPVARQTEPHTNFPERPRLTIETYIVGAGDTVQSIADRYGLEPTSVMWANSAVEDAPDLLRLGQEVLVLPVDGAYHQVRIGDTIDSIARRYKVDAEAITGSEYNELLPPDFEIEEGMWLVVPDGEKPYVPRYVTSYTGSVPEGAFGSGVFDWPVLGAITQGYWYGHRAIDIAAPTGSAVLATDGGYISFSGWTDVGYGNLIVIDHRTGYATYYAHLSDIYVYEGQAVERGDVVGAVGSTGWSTGPHLHFEIRLYGVQQNPRAHLP